MTPQVPQWDRYPLGHSMSAEHHLPAVTPSVVALGHVGRRGLMREFTIEALQFGA